MRPQTASTTLRGDSLIILTRLLLASSTATCAGTGGRDEFEPHDDDLLALADEVRRQHRSWQIAREPTRTGDRIGFQTGTRGVRDHENLFSRPKADGVEQIFRRS